MRNIKTYGEILLEEEGQSTNEMLYQAVGLGKPSLVISAIEDGADPNYVNKNGRSLLTYATFHGNDEIVRILIDNGADPNVKDSDGGMESSPLHWAAEKDYDGIAKILLDAGADPNIEDKYGNNTLYWAVKRLNTQPSKPEIIEMLLKAGADPLHQNNWGSTPIAVAAHQKATNVLAAMLSFSPKALRSFETEESLIEAFGGEESMVPANILQDWRNMNRRMQKGKSAFGM